MQFSTLLSLFPKSSQSTQLDKASVGRRGEEIAVGYLKEKKYHICEVNYRIKRWGEVDIVALNDDQLVLVEVKTRIGDQKTDPLDAVRSQKINTLVRCGMYYQSEHDDAPASMRIDVITVVLDNALEIQDIQHYENIHASFGKFSKRV